MKGALVRTLGLAVLVGCSTSGTDLSPVTSRIANSISESRSGGNPDLFFATPLAPTPHAGDPNFDDGASNGAVVPYVRICETDGAASPTGCVVDVTQATTGSATGLAMTYGSGVQLYQVNWQTKALDPNKAYRIEVWGLAFSTAAQKAALDPRWLFGWEDIRNSPSVSSCNGLDPYCFIKYGQTLPIKVRIEQYAFCPTTRNCAFQFVKSGADATLEATLNPASGAPSAQLHIPGQGGTDFALALEPCTTAEDAAVSAAIDIPTFGPCLKTATTFTGSLETAAIVSLCSHLDASSFGLPVSQSNQLALHHLSSDLSRVTALPEAYSCGSATSGTVASHAPSGFFEVAQSVARKVMAWAAPKELYAARIDRGGGGESFDIASFFKLALPAKFEYVAASDASQSTLAGSSVTLKAKVTDLLGGTVKNARVRWSVFSSPVPGASVQSATPVLTDASGIAQATVQLSTSSGFNVFHASGRGIAANGATDCAAPSSSTGSCNGPRGSFDPFMSFHMPEFDAIGSGTEGPVNIAEGTRLPFTIFGCVPGFGTATVDGTFSTGEWACAKTYQFTANVSGGSTPATLYVMNDNSRLYLAVRLGRSSTDKVNTLQFNFDNNNSAAGGPGPSETGDDVLSLDAATGFTDAYMTLKCTNSSQSSCWAADPSGAGTKDGIGALTNDGVVTTYELSHPLNTADDAHDFSLLPGGKVGLFLTLQTGSGAAGNTQWPGFRKYLEIRIEQ